MADPQEEFLAEVQEIIEALSRDLLLLDQGQKEGSVQPDLINEVFRGVHTLKGIAGMFGYQRLGALAHTLEDLLDDLRLGRVQLTQTVLDVLFDGVEGFQRLVVEDGEEKVDLGAFAESIESVSSDPEMLTTGAEYALEPGILSVLTEYEEHRLRTNASQGAHLFRLRVQFGLTSIDADLEDLKERAVDMAEIITYLPSADPVDDDSIELDVLLASTAGFETIKKHFGLTDDSLEAIGTRPIERPATASPPSMLEEPSEVAMVRHTARPPTAEGVPAREETPQRRVTNSVRVDIRKLDHLMNVVGELAIVRSRMGQLGDKVRAGEDLRRLSTDLHRLSRAFERQLEELQAGILGVRMVPLGQLFDRLARIVRQFAREHDKEVHFTFTGAETEIDKLIVEELSDPMMHLIRNAIDHGIESPKVRELAGKEPTGTLALNAYQKGNHVVIEVDDDGGGMNERLLVETAMRKGLVGDSAATELTREATLDLIFMPGFSTRSSITDVSGRGVGMDVVKTNINRLGGVIDVQSELGAGTKFVITLPVTLAIISALIVEVREHSYAIPVASVQEAIVLDPATVRRIDGREVVTLRGETLPLCRLSTLFSAGGAAPEREYIVVCTAGARRLGFVVDSLDGQRDVVIKALGKSLRSVRGFAGATDLGEQRLALVLDAPGLIEEILRSPDLPLLGART
ncbi:MAG: two-component system chemotaxis sensor kinase CheA [Polyangiales bacterium]